MPRRRRKNSNPPPWLINGEWRGKINFRGKQYWVGSFDEPEEWKIAAAEKLLELKRAEELGRDPRNRAMTIAEFAGAGDDKWPRTHATLRRESTIENYTYNLRWFLRNYGDRPLDGGIGRKEAREIASRLPLAAVSSIRAMYSDAIDDEVCDRNPFAGLKLAQPRGRKDINVLTPQEVDELCRVPLVVWPDEFGRMFSAFLRWQAETCMRPGETCALTWLDIDLEQGIIYVRRSRNKRGRDTDPKVQRTKIVLPPRAKAAILEMPRLNDLWLFTNKRGNRLLKVTLQHYWEQVRPFFCAQLPEGHWLAERVKAGSNFDLYELRHFGATWLLERPPFGLGLQASDVAEQLGHLDGGVRVMHTYGHPRARLARQRIQEAFEQEWQQRGMRNQGAHDSTFDQGDDR